MTPRDVIEIVVDQHAEDLPLHWNIRQTLAVAGHVALRHLARFDGRIAADQDGCVVAGASGLGRLERDLEEAGAARFFAAAIVALDAADRAAFDRSVIAAESNPEALVGVTAALGWVSATRLTDIGRELLNSRAPVRRLLGLAACRLHRVDPGTPLVTGLRDPIPGVRAEALRTAGALGRTDLDSSCVVAIDDDDQDCRFSAAYSAVLLGDRNRALSLLADEVPRDAAPRAEGFALALQAMATTAAHRVLQTLATNSAHQRWLIRGSGIVGDTAYLTWLIQQMTNEKTARLAGESFSLMTGVDLAQRDLERKPPENFESGPNDDPDDPNVDMDPDDGLPWPDPKKIETWWAANGSRFQAGTRYFMGQPVTREHCIDVLKNGYQRQRILAAHYLCLLDPGTPLFNTGAPAWRQQRLLAKMG